MLYRSKLFEIVKTHLPEIHCYADDTEVYISLVRPAFSLTTHGKFVDDNLNLNDDKTEFLIIGTPRQLEKVDSTSVCVVNPDIHSIPTARNLGSWFDSRPSMSK